MAHPDYIAAAEQGNRTPTVFMKVESADGDTLYYTTQSDWQGSDTLTNIDTTEEPGSVTNEKFLQDIVLTPHVVVLQGTFFDQSYTATYDQYLNKVKHPIEWFVSTNGNSVLARVRLTIGVDNFVSESILLNADSTEAGGAIAISNGIFNNVKIDRKILLGEDVEITIQIFDEGAFPVPAWVIAFTHLPENEELFSTETVKTTSQVKTSAISFDAVTASNPIFSVDDITEAGASIDYSYEYSDLGSIFTSGGSIVDGDSLIASKFYKITADFATTTGGRGKIREFQLEEGLFRFFGSHIDEPFSGVSPQLVPNSVSGFTQKINIGKGLSTTGQASVKMFWVDETSDLIASGYLKGQDVSIFSGFKGLSTEAYEPVIVGTWFDHSLDEVAGEITVKVQDAVKQFEKRKIPEEDSNPTTGEIDTSSTVNDITFSAESLVTAQKRIFDAIGLRGRYISPDFDTLEAGDYAATKYKVSRVLHKPSDSNKLLDELAQTGSMFLIPLGNGQIKPKPFDINQEHTAELDADFIDFVNLKGNLDKFFTRFNSYYNPKTTLTADPTDDRDDFDNGVALLDSNAELRWFPEKGIKDHFDKWKVGRTSPSTALTSPPQALIDKNNLDNALLTEPLYTVTAKDMGPRFADIEAADVVQVNNLELPVVNNAWIGQPETVGIPFDVSNEDSNPVGMYFSLDGLALYILGLTNATIFQYAMSTPFDLNTSIYTGKSKLLTGESSSPTDIWFSADLSRAYMLSGGFGTGTVFQYDLTTSGDISTAVYNSVSFSMASEDDLGTDITFSPDGSRMYIAGVLTSSVFQYSLSSPFDIGTATYTGLSKDFSPLGHAPASTFFKPDGTRVFILDITAETTFQYNLGTPWDISTAAYSGLSFFVGDEDDNPRDLFFGPVGKNIYILGATTDKLYRYETFQAWTIGAIPYIEGDRVIHDGRMWRSRQDSTDKDPTNEAAFWQDTEILENGLTQGKHFFVLGRKFNPNNALIDLDLMEMPPGTLGAFSADEFSADFDIG